MNIVDITCTLKLRSIRTSVKELSIVLIILFVFTVNTSSQPSLLSFAETGQNNIYNGGYFSCSLSPGCEFGKNNVEGGMLFSFGGEREKNLAAFSLLGEHRFIFLQQSFNITGLYLWKPFSSELRETNWGIVLNLELSHFRFSLGNNYRTYRFSREYIRLNEDIADNSRIVEPLNLIYTFQYNLKKREEKWNLMFSVTNCDYFIIEQETNPMVIFKGCYQINDNIQSFIDIGYKGVGFFNIKVDRFGYFLRLGMKWNIGKG